MGEVTFQDTLSSRPHRCIQWPIMLCTNYVHCSPYVCWWGQDSPPWYRGPSSGDMACSCLSDMYNQLAASCMVHAHLLQDSIGHSYTHGTCSLTFSYCIGLSVRGVMDPLQHATGSTLAVSDHGVRAGGMWVFISTCTIGPG